MIRLAAVGDVHVGDEPDEALAADFAGLGDCADALLLAGDLTRCGTRRETALLAEILERVPGPVVAVLGNHNHHADEVDDVVDCLTSVGVTVLEGDTTPSSSTAPVWASPDRRASAAASSGRARRTLASRR